MAPAERKERTGGLLCRLKADATGNVLAMSAAAIVPIMAMVGGAIDLGRAYMVRTRLQQACDAGALAARRQMANVNSLSATERTLGRKYFDFNFPDGTYATINRVRDYARGEAGVVVGTASVEVQTTLMKIFGYATIPISTACESTLVVPNTDVMFVLDVTGSMAQTVSGDAFSKIDGLKLAVKQFYGALGPGTATGGGRIRYGFMPYSSNVNVGKIVYALNPGYIVGGNGPEEWTYQSREAVTEDGTRYVSGYGTESPRSSGTEADSDIDWTTGWTNQTTAVRGASPRLEGVTRSDCNNATLPPVEKIALEEPTTPVALPSADPAYPSPAKVTTYESTQRKTVRVYQYTWSATFLFWGTCQLQRRDGRLTTTITSTTTTPVTYSARRRFKSWLPKLRSFDVSPVVQNDIMPNPAFFTGEFDTSGVSPNGSTPQNISWNGCIEEARTVPTIVASSSLNIPNDADDLKIDLIPDSTQTRWKPFLRDVVYRGTTWMGTAACPREASPLTSYLSDYVAATQTSPSFNQYVDSLAAVGGTYHDIGLIWGARFLSPDGIYSATNRDSSGPGGYPISRHIVFMTDGDLETSPTTYDPWGITTLDGRIAPMNLATIARNDASHSRRVDIICNAMKGKGFTVWVVGFGIPSLPQQLIDCASDADHASVSTNAAQLRLRFQAIANTIGGLRLSR